jgi:hypothetical protein
MAGSKQPPIKTVEHYQETGLRGQRGKLWCLQMGRRFCPTYEASDCNTEQRSQKVKKGSSRSLPLPHERRQNVAYLYVSVFMK